LEDFGGVGVGGFRDYTVVVSVFEQDHGIAQMICEGILIPRLGLIRIVSIIVPKDNSPLAHFLQDDFVINDF
jgi:hypothetical protein